VAAQDWMSEYLIAAKVSAKLINQAPSCMDFMNNTIGSISDTQINRICTTIDFRNYSSVSNLVNVCEF
jgi:hypothetical protein